VLPANCENAALNESLLGLLLYSQPDRAGQAPSGRQVEEELRRAGWRAALLAEYLIGPHHKRHQIWRRYKPSILAVEVVIADRTGP
jgi:hypothetical protein